MTAQKLIERLRAIPYSEDEPVYDGITPIKRFAMLVEENRSTIISEYALFLSRIGSLPKDKPYYVYALIIPETNRPFYIGKGKGRRAYQHLFDYVDNKEHSLKHKAIEEIIASGVFPEVRILKTCLTSQEAFDFEESLVKKFGRYGKDDDGILTNRIEGGNRFEYTNSKVNSGGKTTRENKSGMFRPDLQHLRSEWARNAANMLTEKGTRGGYCSKEWMEANRETQSANAAKGGAKGGKIVGNMFWWNNGMINKKAFECPGEGFVRGQIMSEKKRNAFRKMKESQKRD